MRIRSLADIHGVHRLFLILLLAFLAGFGPLCTDMYLPALPLIANQLHMSTSLTQASIGVCLLGLAVGQIIIGPISDGLGRKGLLLASLVLFTVASLFCAITDSALSFICFRFLQGLGGAGGAVLCRAASCDSFSGAKLTQFLALFMAVTGIAPVVGPLIGGALAATGWQSIFWVLTGIGLLLCLASLVILPETLATSARIQGGIVRSFQNMAKLRHEPAFLWYAGVQGFTAAGFFCYIASSPFIFQNLFHFSVQEFSIFFGVNAFILTLSSLAAGQVSVRFGDKAILLFGNIVRAIACLGILGCAVRSSTAIPLMLCLCTMLAGQGLTKPTSFSLAIMAQHVGAGAASGVLGVVFFICGAMASPLAGLGGADSLLPLGIISFVSGLGALFCTIKGVKLH